MKKILIVLLLGTFTFFTGCMSESMLSPEEHSINTKLNGKSWITIENTTESSLQKDFTASQLINGKQGGVLELNNNLGNIFITGSLTVPKNAFKTTENIQVTFAQSSTFAEYQPETLSFDRPLVLSLKYTGINLNGIDPRDVDFYYEDEYGNLEVVEYDYKVVDVTNKVLEVVNAKIPHFSRYGWAK